MEDVEYRNEIEFGRLVNEAAHTGNSYWFQLLSLLEILRK